MKCPYCNSKNIKKSGFLKSGKRRYECLDCKKGFSENTSIKKPLNKICPVCGSSNISRSGFNKNGSQRYLCKDCRKKFSDSTRIYSSFKVVCPKCGKDIAIKAGFDKDKQQYYKCKNCNHKFLLQGKYKHINDNSREQILSLLNDNVSKKQISKDLNISEKTVYKVTKNLETPLVEKEKEIKEQIKKDILNGINIKKISEKYNKSVKYINRIAEPLYNKEVITKEQEQMIIKYGVCLNVPVEYLAEYVPCSEHKCLEIIKHFKAG